MTDRLKQIWGGFEETTSRHLTGGGVDNIHVPHRVDYAAVDETFLPENFHAPAETAFAALRDKLAAQERKFGRKKGGARRAYTARDEAGDIASARLNGDELIRGLKATSMRTERPERDYGAFLASDAGRAVFKKHKKKKRFGIF